MKRKELFISNVTLNNTYDKTNEPLKHLATYEFHNNHLFLKSRCHIPEDLLIYLIQFAEATCFNSVSYLNID